MTKEYENIPENAWVLARKMVGGVRKPFNGWIVGNTGLCYDVFDPNIQKQVKVAKEYVFSLPEVDGEITEEAMEYMRKREIDMALDRKDKLRFKELTGGEASGTDEELLRPVDGD